MRRKLWIGLLAISLIATACAGDDQSPTSDAAATEEVTEQDEGSGDPSGATNENTAAASDISIGMAIAGPRDDGGFYQGHYDGLMAAAEEHGFETAVVEKVEDPQSQLDALRNLAQEGHDLVIGGSSAFSDAAEILAPQFPDTTFVVSAGVINDAPSNLHAYFVRQGAASYVAGHVAAALSETNQIAFLGGLEIPPTIQAGAGFEAGTLDADASVGFSSTNVGTFNDPAIAKEAAEAQIAAGVDVIYLFLNAATPGVYQAVEESGADVKLMTAPAPRCDESDAMAVTGLFNVPGMVNRIVEDFLNGELPDGTRFFALEDPNVQRVEICPAYSTPELEELVEELTRKINDGEIELPEGV